MADDLNYMDILPRMRRLPGFLDMQQVCEGVFIGPALAARSPAALTDRGITRILSANGEKPMVYHMFGEGDVLVVDMEDDPQEDLLSRLDTCVKFLEDSVAAGHNVVVTCTAGMSRSASVVTAYLMHAQGLSMREALRKLTAARPFVRPNPGFIAQLHVYEARLRGDKLPECALQPGPRCELCELKKETHWFNETEAFVVLECSTCDLPMVVCKAHTMQASQSVLMDMEVAVREVADEVLGAGSWFLDRCQRTIPDHLHWHARPMPPAVVQLLSSRRQSKL